MKITPSTTSSALSAVSSHRSAGTDKAASNASGKNTVELSPAARQLAGLQNSDNDIDLQRIQQIRDAIASGQLKINTERIADSLLSSVRELLK